METDDPKQTWVAKTSDERLQEHKRAVRNLSTASELDDHILETGHGINWHMAKILNYESWHDQRLFKEAWYTKVFRSSNKVFYNIDHTWDPLCSPT